MKHFKLNFRAKAGASKNHGVVDIELTTEAKTVAEVKRKFPQLLADLGHDKAHFFAPDIVETEAPEKPAHQAPHVPELEQLGAVHKDDLGDSQAMPQESDVPESNTEHVNIPEKGSALSIALMAGNGDVLAGLKQLRENLAQRFEIQGDDEIESIAHEMDGYLKGRAVDQLSHGARQLIKGVVKQQEEPEPEPEPEKPADEQVKEINLKVSQLRPGQRLRLENVPAVVYRRTRGYGSTDIKLFIQCPYKLKLRKDGLLPQKENPTFDVGRAVHDAVLLPDAFESDYIEQPAEIKQRRGKAWDEFKASVDDGVTILTGEQFGLVHTVSGNVLNDHPQFFMGGSPEVSYWYRHPIHPLVVLKARIDYEIEELAVDLKTTGDANPDDIDKNMFKFGYHLQDHQYRTVSGLDDMTFIFAGKEPPHLTADPVVFDDEARMYASSLFEDTVESLSECLRTGKWPAYRLGGYRSVSMPGWMRKKAIDEGMI